MVLILIVLYLVGYIGMNLQTIAVVLNRVIGMPIMVGAVIVAIISLAYMHSGGQMSVLMTDLFQSMILLVAGIGIFVLGINYVGGWDAFWNGLPATHKVPFPNSTSRQTFTLLARSGATRFQALWLSFSSIRAYSALPVGQVCPRWSQSHDRYGACPHAYCSDRCQQWWLGRQGDGDLRLARSARKGKECLCNGDAVITSRGCLVWSSPRCWQR